MRLPGRSGDQVRIGVAIPVPDPFGPGLQSARARFGDPLASSIPPHVTLLGPTVVEPADLPAVIGHLGQVAAACPSFDLHLRGTGSFRPVSPVVFVQVAQGIAHCERLERAVRCGPLAQPLRFNYHPHVTVAHDLPDDALDRAYEELAHYRASFRVTGFQVYEHGDDGVWRPVQDHPLTGPDRVPTAVVDGGVAGAGAGAGAGASTTASAPTSTGAADARPVGRS